MRWVILAVGLLAVTAGCNTVGDSGTETPTVTPAPVPTHSPTPEDPRVGVAPGLSAGGITHPNYLATHHAEAATETSYVWMEFESTTRQYRNETVDTSESQVVTFEDETTYRRQIDAHEITIDGRETYVQGYEEYANGDVEYTRWVSTDGEGYTYTRDSSPDAARTYASLAAESIRKYLNVENETVERIDVGEGRHYVVVGTRSTLPEYGPVDEYRARAIVREDGFVRSLDVRYTRSRDGDPVRAHYSFTYRQVGNATVEPPDWESEAADRFGDA